MSRTEARPPEMSASPRQRESDARRETREEAGVMRDSIERHTRAGGSIGAMRSASGVSSASQRRTTPASSRSSRASASKRWRARRQPKSDALARPVGGRRAGAHEALLELQEPPAHVGLHRPQRAAQVAGQFRMRQAMEKRERDRLALLGVELAQAALQPVGFG